MIAVLEIIGLIFIFIGVTFFILGTIGLYRMPDVFNRMQASTKTTTMGFMSVVLGVGIIEPSWLLKCLLMIAFIALTAPIGASALAKAAYKSGVPLVKGTVVDDCRRSERCSAEEVKH